MAEIPIYPNLKKTILMVKCRYNIFNYLPFTSAQISAQLFDENDLPVETRIYQIDNTNGFDKWGADDTYIQNWIKTKLQEN